MHTTDQLTVRRIALRNRMGLSLDLFIPHFLLVVVCVNINMIQHHHNPFKTPHSREKERKKNTAIEMYT